MSGPRPADASGAPAPPAAAGPDGVRLHALTVGHRRDRRVLTGVHAHAAAGQLTVLLGPNGSGKSTLLRTLAGLLSPLSGTATLGDDDLPGLAPAARARRVGVVLTDRPDAGLLTGREVVALGRHPYTGVTGTLGADDRAVVEESIAAVGASALADRRLLELSDGERQRLLVARALAQRPSLLLLDEPSAFLDVSARVALLGLLRRLAHRQGICVLLSTHDLELALRLADAAWLIDRAGTVHTGTPEALVAAGTVGRVFDTDDLHFDATTGTFRLETHPPA